MQDSITITEEHINRLKDLDLIVWYGLNHGLDIEMGVEPMFTTPKEFEHKTIYDVTDIQFEFRCGRTKAYQIMVLLYDMKYAEKLGKSYYISKEMLNKFMSDNKGKTLYI